MITPVCSYCTHFDASRRDAEVCPAYPKGIPAVILQGRSVHLTSIGDDNGIVFTPKPGFEYMGKKEEQA